jgi:hypothetical protein
MANAEAIIQACKQLRSVEANAAEDEASRLWPKMPASYPPAVEG